MFNEKRRTIADSSCFCHTIGRNKSIAPLLIKGRFYKFNLSLANSQNLIKATANVILLSQI